MNSVELKRWRRSRLLHSAAAALATGTLVSTVIAVSASATEPDRTPPVVTLSGTAVKAVENGSTTGTFELHIVATDGSKGVPQSGVAKIEVAVDGSGQQAWEKKCPEGSCGLEVNWTYSPATYSSEFPRWITVKVTDQVGNTSEQEISIEGVEEVPREVAPTGTDLISPLLSLSGSAVEAIELGTISGRYELRMFSKDGLPSAPQSGIGKLEVAVDGTTVQSWEKPCPIGSCRLKQQWSFAPASYPGTSHVITVTARDRSGNQSTRYLSPDTTPPVLSLSGPATEGLGTGTNSYPLHVHASDGDPEAPASGVRRITILVDETQVSTMEQGCPQGSCPMDTDWTFEPAKYGVGAHEILVQSQDQRGNQSETSLQLAPPDGSLPGCNPLDPASTASTPQEVIPIAGGGSRSVYRTSSTGLTLEFLTPPPSFNPISATDAELEKYGFPERPGPGDSAGRSAWEEGLNGAVPSVATACNGAPISSRNDTTRYNQEPGTIENPFWTGIGAFEVNDKEAWRAIKGKFSVGLLTSSRCDHGRHSAWVGLGGVELGGRAATALLQTGVTYLGFGGKGNEKPYSWIELIPRHPNGNVESAIPLGLPVHHGDRVEAYVRYDPASGRATFFQKNITDHEYLPPFRVGGVTAQEYWDGSTAEFVDENGKRHGNRLELENFGKDTWTNTLVRNLAGVWERLGDVPRRRFVLQRSPASALQAYPEALNSDQKSFSNIWVACRP